MRLSTPSALDHTLASWAERLRERLDLPLLVRWQGGSLRLGESEHLGGLKAELVLAR